MDKRSNGAMRRGTVIGHVETLATNRLIAATDAALGRLWNRYSTAELRELAQSLHTGRPAPIVERFDSDLGRIFGGEP